MSSADTGGERTSAADLAAGALLGALVWDPRRADDVRWLRGDDFSRPTDAAVYATITGLLDDGRRTDARTIEVALRAGDYHDMRGRIRDNPAVVLHTLLATTPAAPPEPGVAEPRSEHVRYGQLVLDDAIRREVTAAGARIGQTTRAAVTVDHEAAAERIDDVFDETADRLQALTERHRSSSPGGLRDGLTTTVQADASGPDVRRGPDRGGTVRDPLHPREVLRAEQRLIGSCLAEPSVRRLALEHLRPTDFADRAAAATWSAISDLSRDDGPVDYVFVAAELERRAAADPAQGLAPAKLRDLSARALPGTGDLDTVARAALQRIGQRAERDLTAAATDKVHRGADVLDAAQKAVASARETARRVGSGSGGARAGPGGRPAPPAQRSAPTPPSTAAPPSGPPTPVRETLAPNSAPRRRS